MFNKLSTIPAHIFRFLIIFSLTHTAYASNIDNNEFFSFIENHWIITSLAGVIFVLAPDFLFKEEIRPTPIIIAIAWVIFIVLLRLLAIYF